MPIIRTIPASNFTIINNAIANDATVSATATAALLYLISKPPHWKFNAYDLKRRLNVGLNKVYRVMRELIQAGYAFYKRTQSACEWFIYDTPQNIKTTTAPAVIDRVNFEHVKNECVLERIELLERNTTTQPPQEIINQPDTINPVVVLEKEKQSELIYPENISVDDLNACQVIAKKVKKPELTQDILFELAYIITSGNIKKSIPACLYGLVMSANEQGYFKRTQAAGASNKGGKPLIPIWQGFGQSTPSKPEVASGFINQAKAALRGIAI